MNFRSDLAMECRERCDADLPGLRCSERSEEGVRVTRIEVLDETGARNLGKPVGKYVTLEVAPFGEQAEQGDPALDCLVRELRDLLPEEGPVLAVGLGNEGITPDALGPRCAQRLLATRHISGELARSAGLGNLRPLACLAPGVLGETGMETGEIVAGVVKETKPAAVLTIDALAARSLGRLGRTVQMTNSGIAPGSGVGNARTELSAGTLGVPVISVGVPTVVDAQTLAGDLLEERTPPPGRWDAAAEQMMVTPREVDLMIDRAAKFIALAINCAMQPHMMPEEFLAVQS
ncbi:MAG: GPR endopeptidase [Oscillospiraceae bacterium]|jgi:spore protease|nr:GPR endopeptidase [Oscillospiraceae bacterium]